MRRLEIIYRDHSARQRIGALLIILCVALTERAVASSPSKVPELPADPVLADLIKQSLAALPDLAKARALAQADRERAVAVGAYPDPMLQLGIQNDGFSKLEIGKMETSWYSIMISQTFPWPGKLPLRSEIAEISAKQADQNIVRLRLTAEAEVRRAYLNLVFARDRLTLLDSLEAIWQKSDAVAKARYETGQGAQSDVLRIQLELNRIRQRRFALQVEADTQVQTLNRMRAHPLNEAIDLSTHLTDLALPVPRDEMPSAQDALDRSPELASAVLEVKQAEKLVGLAGKSSLPDITVNVGLMPRGGDFPTMWLVNIGGAIPLFTSSKQDREVAGNEARLAGSRRNVEALDQLLRLRVAQRRTALVATLETIKLYRDGLLVQSEAAVDSTLAQYEVGKLSLASVFQANAGLIADQEGYLQALAQVSRFEIDAFEVSLAPIASASAGMETARMPNAGANQSGDAAQGSSSSSM